MVWSPQGARHHRPERARSRAMPNVVLQRNEAVLEIVLNRPEVLNAANRELIAELAAATAEAAEDRKARVVLLRGAGTHFCAGGGITRFGGRVRLAPGARPAGADRKHARPSTIGDAL